MVNQSGLKVGGDLGQSTIVRLITGKLEHKKGNRYGVVVFDTWGTSGRPVAAHVFGKSDHRNQSEGLDRQERMENVVETNLRADAVKKRSVKFPG